MKLIKTAFIIALLNFMVVGAIVLASKSVQKNVEVTNTVKATFLPTITSVKAKVVVSETKTVAVPTADNRCLIQIDGSKYDVSQFRNLHSGGDIFQCGSDMSAIFHNRHDNSYLARLSPYKI